MASKTFAALYLLLLFCTYGAAQTSEGCVWAALNTQDCDAKACPHDTLEVGRGKAGACSPTETQICTKGQRKLCCPRTLQLRNCKWQGSAPICKPLCPQGYTKIAQDGWGDGYRCTLGCKNFCCEVLS